MEYLPVFTASAFFSSVALLQLAQRNWQKLPLTFLYAILSVVLLTYIVNTQGPILAWVLLGIPAAILVLGAIFRLELRPMGSTQGDSNTNENGCDCPCCHSKPCSCPQPCPAPKPKRC